LLLKRASNRVDYVVHGGKLFEKGSIDFIGSLSEIVESSRNNQFKILLLHNYIEEVDVIPPHTPEYSIINRDELEKIQVDVVLVGHYHERSGLEEEDNLKFIVPGAIGAVDLSEKGPFGV